MESCPLSERISDVYSIKEGFNSGDITEQRLAIGAVLFAARLLEQGPQLDKDRNGMNNSEHHWWGGPENAPIIADSVLYRRFYTDPQNRNDIRRDVHTHIERVFGWPVLPPLDTVVQYIETSETHITSRVRKALDDYRRGR